MVVYLRIDLVVVYIIILLMWYSPCVCWVCLVYTLPVYVEYVWYIILILLDIVLYGTCFVCLVCLVCLVCIGPSAWSGRWVQLIFSSLCLVQCGLGVFLALCDGILPGDFCIEMEFAWRFLHWDGICLEISVLRYILQKYWDISCEKFLQAFVWWEIFASIFASIVWWCCVK